MEVGGGSRGLIRRDVTFLREYVSVSETAAAVKGDSSINVLRSSPVVVLIPCSRYSEITTAIHRELNLFLPLFMYSSIYEYCYKYVGGL